MSIRKIEEIESWQMAREVCRAVAKTVAETRIYSLRDQMLRSSGSIMDNIAEGFDAGSNREFIRFLQYSKRSCSELQSQLYRALDQGIFNNDEFESLYREVASTRSKIGGFINYLSKNIENRSIADSR